MSIIGNHDGHWGGDMSALLALMGGGGGASSIPAEDPLHAKRKRADETAANDAPLSSLWSASRTALRGAGNQIAPLKRLCRRAFQEQAYWKPADRPPINIFERLADEVFWKHARQAEVAAAAGGALDLARCGAEWWVQVRGPHMKQGASLGFHWDLDYARSLCPAVATVTYLTDRGGAPTVVFDAQACYGAMNTKDEGERAAEGTVAAAGHRRKGRAGAVGKCQPVRRGFVSFPEIGKHIAFRGDLLHGVPAELNASDARPGGAAQHQHQHQQPAKKHKKKKKRKMTAREDSGDAVRVTFLVNVWLNSGKLPEIGEFDSAAFQKELASAAAPGTGEELRLFNDVAFNLFGAPADASSSKGGGGTKQLSGAIALARVRTNRETPVQGLYFGKEDEPFELWLPSPALHAGSTEVTFGGRDGVGDCIVNRCW